MKVANKVSELKQDIVLKSVAIIEDESVIHRNRLLLEHVMLERKKERERGEHQSYVPDGKQSPAYQTRLDLIPMNGHNKRRPPSKLQIEQELNDSAKLAARLPLSSVLARITQVSRTDQVPEEESNQMVFLKNERMIYF